tara:strand:- start:399 stop:557 length:159 start_codon:yes stop_codon:yes gene_type:complete
MEKEKQAKYPRITDCIHNETKNNTMSNSNREDFVTIGNGFFKLPGGEAGFEM